MTKKKMKKVLGLTKIAIINKDKFIEEQRELQYSMEDKLDEANEKIDTLIKARDRLRIAFKAHYDMLADLKAELGRQEDVIYDLRTDKYEKELKPFV